MRLAHIVIPEPSLLSTLETLQVKCGKNTEKYVSQDSMAAFSMRLCLSEVDMNFALDSSPV